MAEAVLFSLAGKLLGELVSPPFKKAYRRVRSIWIAKKDLHKFRQTIEIIKAVLLDAEKKYYDPESPAAVREWIQMVTDVLYDADDLFDDVATDALLKQQQAEKKNELLKVLASLSNMFPAIVSNVNIAKKVKAIRKRLDEISAWVRQRRVEFRVDMDQFKFMQSENEVNVLREREQTTPFVDEKVVIGRENEKNDILNFIFDESDVEKSVSVICIVGIGGMGKTTLAQLIYNDKEVQDKFENKWWACISNIGGETNALEKIARSIEKDFSHGSDARQLIQSSVKKGSSYLLVLDDVWDNDDLAIWVDIMSLLSSGKKGSKLIVTTRLESVKREFENYKSKIYILNGLAEDKSWELFKKRAFTKKQETDVQRWTDLGLEIMKKCSNVPLVIKAISSLLRGKDIQEWEDLNKNELLKIKLVGDSIMSTLKLSYDHLPSYLKNCFAYCSLFPQDHIFLKKDLISKWIAQGYVNPNDNETFEGLGHSYFMELFRKSFFQEAEEDEYGEIRNCKMHDLMHDLAKEVAGKECLTLTTEWNQFSKNARHLYVCFGTDVSGEIPQSLFDANRIRSCFFTPRLSHSQPILDGLLKKSKLLRSLDLSLGGLKNVPDSIGELKHLRYLNLYGNNELTSLPGSLTNLVNLLTLNIVGCFGLKELPIDFRKLIKLKHFYNQQRYGSLRQMPPGFEELTSLQHLDYFLVGEKVDCCSGIDVLNTLKLKGKLWIKFKPREKDCDVDEQWKLPKTLQELRIEGYPGRRIPHWESGDLLPAAFVRIEIYHSSTIEHLPPFRSLPRLKVLELVGLIQLEYLEEEEEGGGHSTVFFPCLEILLLSGLTRLKGWSMTLTATTSGIIEEQNHPSFLRLSHLQITDCGGLKRMPLCPNLRSLDGKGMSEELTQQLLSASPSKSSLETLQLHIAEFSMLEEVEWHSLPKLRKLDLFPRLERLPDSLQKLIHCGQLQVQFPSTEGSLWDLFRFFNKIKFTNYE